MDRLQSFHHVALTVRDLETSATWYRDVLTSTPGAILNFSDPDGIALALFWERS
jgi:hypothetical protein